MSNTVDEFKSVIKSTLTILLTINFNHCVAWDMSDFVSLENIKTRITWYASQLYIPYYEKYDNSACLYFFFFIFSLQFKTNLLPYYQKQNGKICISGNFLNSLDNKDIVKQH